MVKGILVYTSADAEYNEWFIDHIIEEGRKCNLDIRLVLSDKEEVSDNDIDFAIVRNRDSIIKIHMCSLDCLLIHERSLYLKGRMPR